MLQIKGQHGTAIVFTRDVEQSAFTQIQELMDQPFVKDAHVRIMPDVHAGMGCVIGTTMRVVDKVCPNLVGVDVGCGVLVARLPLEQEAFNPQRFDKLVRRIPAGFSVNDRPLYLQEQVALLSQLRCFPQIRNIQRIYCSLGTLGGGNHFIEVAARDAGQLYLLIHSGSRNLGTQVARHYQQMAIRHHHQLSPEAEQALADRLKAQGREKQLKRELRRLRQAAGSVPEALAYLEGAQLADYLNDMGIAQRWAAWNREVMAQRILEDMKPSLVIQDLEVFQTVHNYIDDRQVLRKGAVSAHAGEKLVIPLNMRDGSLIARGLGNPEWNHSAPHGAGRVMSRSEARRSLNLQDFKAAMAGIYSSTLDHSTIDEAPMAYKSMADILGNIGDTVEILEHIRPIYNFKAAGD